jgi:hypothetical protein
MIVQNISTDAQSLHDDIMGYIGQADALLGSGQVTSLVGLDAAVDTLCQRILALDADEAKKFAPQLEELLACLGALQEKMQTALVDCKSDVDDLDKHQKAAKAYQGKKGKK